jgi:hypothetical protein
MATISDYFAPSPVHAETTINEVIEEGHMDSADLAEATVGVKRALLQSPEKSAKKARVTSSSTKKKKNTKYLTDLFLPSE